MFVFNYSNENLKIAYRGHVYTLPANELSYVDENWCSLAEIKKMFGNYVEQVDSDTAIEEFYFDNQSTPEFDTLYLTQFINTGKPRLFIQGGNINIYFSDAEKVPTSKQEMEAVNEYQNISGLVVFPTLTKYMLFEVAHGDPQVVISNINCYPSNELE